MTRGSATVPDPLHPLQGTTSAHGALPLPRELEPVAFRNEARARATPDAARSVASDVGEDPTGRSSETARFTRNRQRATAREPDRRGAVGRLTGVGSGETVVL
jgi:hypothetical protein